MNNTILHALDFDGVICDSAVETAITGWKAASQIWTDMPATAPQAMIDQFRWVRPIIETGYEAILAMHLLYLGESCEAIFGNYAEKTQQLLAQTPFSTDDLKKLFGETRDHWIAADLADWISMNPLFPGVAEKLQKLGKTDTWYVITTKQERFVQQILKANAIELAEDRIFGLDRNLSKPQVLKGLLKTHPKHTIHFVEDRLPTLINVQNQPELSQIELLFALWGYNTVKDRALAAQQGFTSLNLEDFLRDAADMKIPA